MQLFRLWFALKGEDYEKEKEGRFAYLIMNYVTQIKLHGGKIPVEDPDRNVLL